MKRRVLGKGIEEIITSRPYEKKNEIVELNIEEIYPNPFQPRKFFSEEKIKELADSMKESGIIQPIVVFKENDKFYLFVGERRWRAAQYLKWEKIPAIIRDLSSDDAIGGTLIENIQRENLNPIEIAEGIEMFMKKKGLNHEETGNRLGMNRTTVTNYLRLLKLPDLVKQGLIKGDITQGHARALLSLESNEDIIANYFRVTKNALSVRQTELLVKRIQSEVKREESALDPDLKKIESKLEKFFSTRVRLNYQKKGNGKIEIYFHQLAEFQRIYQMLIKE